MAKRRPSGDGMVRKREDGRWEGRIVVGHAENGDFIFRYLYAGTRKELTAKLRQNIDIYQGIDLTEQSRMALTEWLEQWLDRWLEEYATPRLRESTMSGYICTVIRGASWYRKAVVALDGDGAKPVPVCKARVPAAHLPAGVVPEEGDYLVRGVLAEVQRAPADFAGREYALLIAVGDNRRGHFPHWALSGG